MFFVGGDDLTGALRVLQLQLSCTTSIIPSCNKNPERRHSGIGLPRLFQKLAVESLSGE